MIILQSKFVAICLILRHNSILPELISSSTQHDLAHIQAKLEVCLDRIILHYSYSFNIVISLSMKQTHKVQLYLLNATKHMRPHNNQNIEWFIELHYSTLEWRCRNELNMSKVIFVIFLNSSNNSLIKLLLMINFWW